MQQVEAQHLLGEAPGVLLGAGVGFLQLFFALGEGRGKVCFLGDALIERAGDSIGHEEQGGDCDGFGYIGSPDASSDWLIVELQGNK